MKRIAVFIFVLAVACRVVAQERENAVTFYASHSFGVSTSISNPAYSLFRDVEAEAKAGEIALACGLQLKPSLRLGVEVILAGYYADNIFEEYCSLNTFAFTWQHLYQVRGPWQVYFATLAGATVAANELTIGGEAYHASRWGVAGRIEIGPQFNRGGNRILRLALFYSLHRVQAATATDFADTYRALHLAPELTNHHAITTYGIRGSFGF